MNLPALNRKFSFTLLLMAALFGILSPARAQSTAPRVRVIYLVPSDKTERPEYKKAMENAIRHLQRWYWVQMEGKTFRLNTPVVEVVKTSRPSSYYAENENGDFNLWFWNNVTAEGFALMNAGFNDPLNRWVFYIDAENQPGQMGGAGTSGVCILPQHDLLGLVGAATDVPRVARWVGGLGHELGHAFELPHPSACGGGGLQDNHPTCQSIMYLGYIPYPATYFLPQDKETLNASAFFTEQLLTTPTVDSGDLLGTALSGSGDGLNATYYNNADFTGEEVSRIDPWIALDGAWGPPAPGIQPTTFSVRWTGLIQPLRTEKTAFKLNVDGGVRLWVNGQSVIDRWQDMGAREWVGSIDLTANEKVEIKLEYFSNSGTPRVKMLWSGPATIEDVVPQAQLYTAANRLPRAKPLGLVTSMNKSVSMKLGAFDPDGEATTFGVAQEPANGSLSGTPPTLTYTPNAGFAGKDTFTYRAKDGTQDGVPVPVTVTVVTPGAGTGLRGTYFNNTTLTSPGTPRTDGTVNFDWGGGSPMGSINADDFSVRWIGLVQPQLTETYTFLTQTDDGVRLWVDGKLLVDKWVDQGPTEWSGSVPMEAGKQYEIKMEYYEKGGGAVAKLLWSSPSIPKQVIPRTQLYPTGAVTNRPPVAPDMALDTPQGIPLEFVLSATDPDLNPLTYAVTSQPAHGTFTGTAPALTYTPAPGFTGNDSFGYKANDGQADSNIATVTIKVIGKLPPGDVNGDGSTNVVDAVMALQSIVGILQLTAEQKERADLSPAGAADGKVDVSDAVEILKRAVGGG